MKKLSLIAILLFVGLAQQSIAQKAYHVHLKMSHTPDSMVYLAHYYGKGGEKVYKTDSAFFDKNGVADMKSNDPDFTGGIYMLFLSDKKTVFEVLMDKGIDVSITADKDKLLKVSSTRTLRRTSVLENMLISQENSAGNSRNCRRSLMNRKQPRTLPMCVRRPLLPQKHSLTTAATI